jgi:AraC-like DNA-binding protein
MVPQHIELTPEAILDYIEQHYAEPIGPRDVAEAMHYSLCHVTHVSRRRLGMSVSGLILQRRIAAARCLLEESAIQIAHVAARVGFADVAYFSRRFSRAMGASPSRWRKLHREGADGNGRCHTCGGVLPSVAFAQDDAAHLNVAAS